MAARGTDAISSPVGPMRLLRASLLLAAGALLAGASAAATNQLSNAAFDSDLSGWEVVRGGTDAVWDPLDRSGDSGSGSALITMPEGSPGLVFGLGQCVPAVAGGLYDLAGSVRIPDSTGDGAARMQVSWYASEGCSDFIEVVRSPIVDAPSVDFVLTEETLLAAPPGTSAAEVRLSLAQSEGDTGDFSAYFDDVALVPEPGAAPLQGTALGALLALRIGRERGGWSRRADSNR